MRRVVITGIGIVSCLGNNKKEVLDSLEIDQIISSGPIVEGTAQVS